MCSWEWTLHHHVRHAVTVVQDLDKDRNSYQDRRGHHGRVDWGQDVEVVGRRKGRDMKNSYLP